MQKQAVFAMLKIKVLRYSFSPWRYLIKQVQGKKWAQSSNTWPIYHILKITWIFTVYDLSLLDTGPKPGVLLGKRRIEV